MPNRVLQNHQNRIVDTQPLRFRQVIAAGTRVDRGEMQNLRRIQVPDPGDLLLVEQSVLDGAAAAGQPFAKVLRSDL